MKRMFSILFVVFLLSGCTTVKEHRAEQEQYEQLQAQIENGSLAISDVLPFDYEITLSGDDHCRYTLTIDHFEHAMYDIKVVAMPLNTNGECSSLGFDEDIIYKVIPNQENTKKGCYSALTLEGTLTSEDDLLGVVIQWKDASEVNTSQCYWVIDCAREA